MTEERISPYSKMASEGLRGVKLKTPLSADYQERITQAVSGGLEILDRMTKGNWDDLRWHKRIQTEMYLRKLEGYTRVPLDEIGDLSVVEDELSDLGLSSRSVTRAVYGTLTNAVSMLQLGVSTAEELGKVRARLKRGLIVRDTDHGRQLHTNPNSPHNTKRTTLRTEE